MKKFSSLSKTRLVVMIIAIFILLPVVAISLVYVFFHDNLVYIYSSVILDNQSTILFRCDEFGDEAQLFEIAKDLPQSDPDFYTLLKEISVNDDFSSGSEPLMILPVEYQHSSCPGKYQFEIWFSGHEDRVKLNKYLPDGRLHGVPVFLRNV